MNDPRKLRELALELEQKLAERGQSLNAVAQYHYIFNVFIAYSQSFGAQYFSREILERCLQEHYGITNQTVLARRQHYKKRLYGLIRCSAIQHREIRLQIGISDQSPCFWLKNTIVWFNLSVSIWLKLVEALKRLATISDI